MTLAALQSSLSVYRSKRSRLPASVIVDVNTYKGLKTELDAYRGFTGVPVRVLGIPVLPAELPSGVSLAFQEADNPRYVVISCPCASFGCLGHRM